MARRTGWMCLAAGVLLASVLWGEDGVVRTKDGFVYEGEVTETSTHVTIKSHGVETVIPRGDVASKDRAGDYEQEFRARLGKLEAQDVAGRVALAREAFDRRQYILAREMLEAAISIDGNNRQAFDLYVLVQNQIRMERTRTEPPTTAPATRPQVSPMPVADRRVLTTADVQAIRRTELQSSDTGVRIRFDGDVKKRFADSQNLSFADFVAWSPVEQALMILQDGDQAMRDKVQILSDPQSIGVYRRQIQPLILQNCATASCHGGPSGAGLVLLTGGESDAMTYTNFFILQRYRKQVGGAQRVFSGNMKRLIERGSGEHSLLANYGLPANIGEYDHPPVNGKLIAPAFRNREDARYLLVVEWMNESLKDIGPDYGIRYTPPRPAPPATQASGAGGNP
jgi:hypothetical protein